MLPFFEDDDFEMRISAPRAARCAHSRGYSSDDDKFLSRHGNPDELAASCGRVILCEKANMRKEQSAPLRRKLSGCDAHGRALRGIAGGVRTGYDECVAGSRRQTCHGEVWTRCCAEMDAVFVHRVTKNVAAGNRG